MGVITQVSAPVSWLHTLILRRGFGAGLALAASSAFAVYAPVPEQEQGKDLTINVRAAASYDSNIFGAPPADEIDSAVYTLAPRITYNASLTNQTFLSASYALTLDRFDKRPGDKLLDSHDLMVRVAHQFSKGTVLDIVESFMIARNPEALLPGLADPVNPDQSFQRNQLDGRFTRPITPKINATLKARTVYYEYRNDRLGRSLDRIENLFGVTGDYAVLPELKGVLEYRRQDVYYRKLGETKNKHSDYLMTGVDYEAARKLTLSGRAGAEFRRRASERDETVPYVELSGKYDYARGSFLVGGFSYSLEETSDTTRFTDTQVNRFFLNLQHALTAMLVASGSVTYEPSKLQGRRGIADVDEDTLRAGAALSYLPTKNWTISAHYDHDSVWSQDAPRDLRRERAGLSASYTF